MTPDYCVHVLNASDGKTSRIIRHFHYTTWPDHGVPDVRYLRLCFQPTHPDFSRPSPSST